MRVYGMAREVIVEDLNGFKLAFGGKEADWTFKRECRGVL